MAKKGGPDYLENLVTKKEAQALSDSMLQLAKRIAELEEAIRSLQSAVRELQYAPHPSNPERRRRIIPMTPADDMRPWRSPGPPYDDPYRKRVTPMMPDDDRFRRYPDPQC